MRIKIDKKIVISSEERPVIVAEISCNHNGSKKLFLKHIREAAKNGADLIKIQTFEPQDITIRSKNKKFLIKSGLWKNKYLWDLYNKAQTPFNWHSDAFKLAKKLKVPLFSSPFSKRAVDLLEKFNVKLYKIASFEITDHELIEYVAKKRKPIIISTGMASLKEINDAVKIIKKFHNKIIILYCVSGYPTKNKEANVSSISKLRKIYPENLIGLSDHTNNIYSSLTSTALGACLIEKHFIISDKMNSLDKEFSISPKALKTLRIDSQKIHETLGQQKIGPKKNEKNSLKLRRSIFSIKEIRRGDFFSKKNIGSFRPLIGLSSKKIKTLYGKKSKKNYKKFQPIF